MNWLEPSIETVTTTEIVFFSKKHSDTCKRICQILRIDIFPDSNHNRYWHLSKAQRWQGRSITKNQRIDSNLTAFNPEIITKMAIVPSNILLSYSEENLSGVIHFTNYNNQHIYQALYKNFYEFEVNFREHLSHLGFSYSAVEEYYEYKLKKDKNENSRKFYTERLAEFRSEKFLKEAKDLSNLQKLGFHEALLFAKSSFHAKETKGKIGLNDVNADAVSSLRNTIMHAKGITGTNSEVPHNFPSFKEFFNQVLSFKKAFDILKKLRTQQVNEANIKFNDYNLSLLRELTDEEIRDYFYSRK